MNGVPHFSHQDNLMNQFVMRKTVRNNGYTFEITLIATLESEYVDTTKMIDQCQLLPDKNVFLIWMGSAVYTLA
jgi:hypothetical protein